MEAAMANMPQQESRARVLIVDDEPDIRESLREILEDEGYQILTAADSREADQLRRSGPVDLVLLDIWMPGEDGLALLKRWAENGLEQPVVMMSGHGTVETAVEATKLGAYDFIEKPLSLEKTLLTIEHALEAARLRQENVDLRRQTRPVDAPSGNSVAINQLRQQIERVALSDSWVLLSGAPGSGKEVAARYLHSCSRRAAGPFVDLKAAAITTPNIAVELFGCETGGQVHNGRLEQANRGTLFIDEIADMDLETQVRLLSALQEGRLLRVGGVAPVQANVRVVAATSRDLRSEMQAGRFREDLFYRLNVVPLRVPTLAGRRQDIPVLLDEFVRFYVNRDGLAPRQFSAGALEVMGHYPWPGNVRELQNLVERLLILAEGPEVSAEEVERALGLDSRGAISSEETEDFSGTLKTARDKFEKAFIEYHLARNSGNIARTAEAVGLERTHLYRKLKSLGIPY
ncbi:sigma-54 dependent transcriptional regulator [Thermithiobacillus plumbiphilus]|uniref:Sigma-54 dependent transcriptional regulator n=1 Tax=Thermithiobacillus plumbiphilus TaxID=1729899 RepID=A0ABU9D9T7_9PROT